MNVGLTLETFLMTDFLVGGSQVLLELVEEGGLVFLHTDFELGTPVRMEVQILEMLME